MNYDAESPLYLDYAATTPVAPVVAERMASLLGDSRMQANPASDHAGGRALRSLLDDARSDVAALAGAESGEVVWTSGATESNNLALKGVVSFANRPGHIISSRTEHKSVIDTLRYLESIGHRVTWLTPERDGTVTPDAVAAALRPETLLVSLMHVNNETGLIQDIPGIATVTRQHGVMLHVDATQSAGKIPIAFSDWGVDLMSLSAHKCYGPKGIGALICRRRPPARIAPLIHGGGHESGLRSGTLPTHQIAGFGVAARLAADRLDEDQRSARVLGQAFRQALGRIDGVEINSPTECSVPGIVNFTVKGVDGEALVMSLPDLAIARGSACTSAAVEPSYVLRALGRSDSEAASSLRVSFGRGVSEDQLAYAADRLAEEVDALHALSPVWSSASDREAA